MYHHPYEQGASIAVGFWPGVALGAFGALGGMLWERYVTNPSQLDAQQRVDAAAARQVFSRRDQQWLAVVDEIHRQWGQDYKRVLIALKRASPEAFADFLARQEWERQRSAAPSVSAGWPGWTAYPCY